MNFLKKLSLSWRGAQEARVAEQIVVPWDDLSIKHTALYQMSPLQRHSPPPITSVKMTQTASSGSAWGHEGAFDDPYAGF